MKAEKRTLPQSYRVRIQTQLSDWRASAINLSAPTLPKWDCHPWYSKSCDFVLPPFCRWRSWGPSPAEDHSFAWLQAKALPPVPFFLLNSTPVKVILLLENVNYQCSSFLFFYGLALFLPTEKNSLSVRPFYGCKLAWCVLT